MEQIHEVVVAVDQTFFEVIGYRRHLIGHAGEADDGKGTRLGQCV